MARIDYDKQADRYDRGRELLPEARASWMLAARKHLIDTHRILDLGSGTGRFSAALAESFDADVIGVEPSVGMRNQAARKNNAGVHILAGTAEAIPLADGTCDAAWLSNVIHHFDDVAQAAGELRRVVVDGGPVLIRGAFAGRGPIPTLYRFFPGTEASIESFPSIPDVFGTFEGAGFTSLSVEKVEQLLAYRLSDMVERLRMRADTTLELLSDEDFERGLQAVEVAARTEDEPVIDSLDLLVAR
jgi:SAM-dependent methyltransferase